MVDINPNNPLKKINNKREGPVSEAVVTINIGTQPHVGAALLLVLALTFDRAGREHTRCHSDPKPPHSIAYGPVNGSPLHTAQCDPQFSQHCHFVSASMGDRQPTGPMRSGRSRC